MTLSPGTDSVTRTTIADVTIPAAVLWDMDGTLLDTEPLWIAAEMELALSYGGVWTQADGWAQVGRAMRDTARTLQERGVPLTSEEIIDALNALVAAGVAANTPWQPGAFELLTAVAAAGVPQALVTSSFMVLAEPFAATAGVFGAVVAGDEVDHPKPHPGPYLLAAERLGVDITRCVAVEDSESGVTAAVASGARTIAVPAVTRVADRPGLRRVETLAGLSLADLGRIAGL
ncbi:HAD family hydrolase [Cellulomonas hominis]